MNMVSLVHTMGKQAMAPIEWNPYNSDTTRTLSKCCDKHAVCINFQGLQKVAAPKVGGSHHCISEFNNNYYYIKIQQTAIRQVLMVEELETEDNNSIFLIG